MQQPRLEVGLLAIQNDTATEEWLVRELAAVFELHATGIDAAADREAKHTELRIGPPSNTGLVVKMANDGRAKVVLRLEVGGVLSAATAVAMRVDHAVDDQLREPGMDHPADVPHVGVVAQ